jgi:excisionase family DNA binding protein
MPESSERYRSGPSDRLLPVGEAAVRLGTSDRCARRLVAQWRNPFVNSGRLLRFDGADVVALIAAGQMLCRRPAC